MKLRLIERKSGPLINTERVFTKLVNTLQAWK